MTSIEVPDWVVELSLDALDSACINDAGSKVSWHGYTRDDRLEVMRAALNAALGAWVVREGYMADIELTALDAARDLERKHHSIIWSEPTGQAGTPLFTLRQEKPE